MIKGISCVYGLDAIVCDASMPDAGGSHGENGQLHIGALNEHLCILVLVPQTSRKCIPPLMSGREMCYPHQARKAFLGSAKKDR